MRADRRLLSYLLAGLLALAACNGLAAGAAPERINLSFHETPIDEVFDMLSQQGRLNILLAKGVSGKVSLNLYEVTLQDAIRLIAESAGYAVERRDSAWLILEREEVGQDVLSDNSRVRTFRVQYTDPAVVEDVVKKHLSRQGKVSQVPGRKLLVVEDAPEFLDRVNDIVAQVDVRPKQILIEARILEITLGEGQEYGIDWHRINGSLSDGTTGLSTSLTGYFLDYVKPELEIFLTALQKKNRVRTLSTPKLLVLENEESEVVVGERLGYKVTTTINQVTTESVQFIESGVILKVTAAVDRSGKIVMDIHPEVSTGSIESGIPNIITTEVTTQLLADEGERIFIGGLMKSGDSETRDGVPLLSDIPLLGNLFSSNTKSLSKTETVVMITPYVVEPGADSTSRRSARALDEVDRSLQLKVDSTLSRLPSRIDNLEAAPEQRPAPGARSAWDVGW